MNHRVRFSIFLSLLVAFWMTPVDGQNTATAFELKTFMVPMRDGVRLNTHVFTPKGQREALPIMLERTPYQAPAGETWAQGKFKSLAADGYIFVIQDIRGRYKSEGQFVMQRSPVSLLAKTKDPKAIDEVTDAYDTIDWLVKNVPNHNGRVGIIGISYPGWTAGHGDACTASCSEGCFTAGFANRHVYRG